MQRCASCGAGIAPGVSWCGQCYAPTATAPAPAPTPGAAPAPFTAGRQVPREEPAVLLRATRWGKTATTFGPLGRTVATFALLVPLALMVVGGLADPFVWGGAGVYAVVVVPWALRDIWKAGQVRIG